MRPSDYMLDKARGACHAALRGAPRSAGTWPPPWLASAPTKPAPEPVVDVPIPIPIPSPWPPRPEELAGWPIDRRERWGRRANELEDAGVRFPGCERQAFREVQAEDPPITEAWPLAEAEPRPFDPIQRIRGPLISLPLFPGAMHRTT